MESIKYKRVQITPQSTIQRMIGMKNYCSKFLNLSKYYYQTLRILKSFLIKNCN